MPRVRVVIRAWHGVGEKVKQFSNRLIDPWFITGQLLNCAAFLTHATPRTPLALLIPNFLKCAVVVSIY